MNDEERPVVSRSAIFFLLLASVVFGTGGSSRVDAARRSRSAQRDVTRASSQTPAAHVAWRRDAGDVGRGRVPHDYYGRPGWIAQESRSSPRLLFPEDGTLSAAWNFTFAKQSLLPSSHGSNGFRFREGSSAGSPKLTRTSWTEDSLGYEGAINQQHPLGQRGRSHLASSSSFAFGAAGYHQTQLTAKDDDDVATRNAHHHATRHRYRHKHKHHRNADNSRTVQHDAPPEDEVDKDRTLRKNVGAEKVADGSRSVRNLQIVLYLILAPDPSGPPCIRCPVDRTILARRGSKCTRFSLPTLASCPNRDSSGRRNLIHLSRVNKRLPRSLPEGDHTITLRLIDNSISRNLVDTCTFKYRVFVNRCEIPPPLENGFFNCTQGRAWGSRCSVQCHPGFELTGANRMTCEGDRRGVAWNRSPPKCVGKRCTKPSSPANGHLSCVSAGGSELEADQPFAPGTVCRRVCPSGFVIAASLLQHKAITCVGPNWSPVDAAVECQEALPPVPKLNHCVHQSLQAPNGSASVPAAEFVSSDGTREAQVECALSGYLKPGLYENVCEATDTELGSTRVCRYTVEVEGASGCAAPPVLPHASVFCSPALSSDSEEYSTGTTCEYECSEGHGVLAGQRYLLIIQCMSDALWNSTTLPECQAVISESRCGVLSPPINGEVKCSSESTCQVSCNSGFEFFSDASVGRVKCDEQSGRWDFQQKLGLDALPDCLGDTQAFLHTNLHFNTTLYDCGDKPSVELIQSNIEQGLVHRIGVICDQVDCTDFAYMCFTLTNLSIMETVWNVMAKYSEEDYDESESESLLTKIQEETHRVITSDSTFHTQLETAGATVMKESYYQGKIDLICAELGYFLDPDSLHCLQCPRGTYYLNRNCEPCPVDTYQDELGSVACKPCPPGTTSRKNAKAKKDCVGTLADQSGPRRTYRHLVPQLHPCFYRNPCQSGGTCIPAPRPPSYLCQCTRGRSGIHCEHGPCPDRYKDELCLNGGKCAIVDKTEAWVCFCPRGFYGTRCELRDE